jgi:hypothetical protein
MLGGVVGVGAVGSETTAEGAETASVEPPLFAAVTVMRSVLPTSAAAGV